MSDNIPFEIQIEIIKKLPIRSLIQYRSVSKLWKSLIDSSNFILHYRGQKQHLLVSIADRDDFDRQYVSIVDDDTFPHNSVSLPLHPFINNLYYTSVINTTHGLLCLYRSYLEDYDNDSFAGRGIVVVWNPMIRKAVVVVVPNVAVETYDTVIGFGVCRETTDPKIVKITCAEYNSWQIDTESLSSIPCQVEVFALSTGVWRRPCNNLPRKIVRFSCYSEVVDGVLYWLADDVEPGFSKCNLIVSFDLTSEEFREVNLPDSLARPNKVLSISKLRESLIVLDVEEGELGFYVVWMMEDGISKSFTKLFTVNADMYPLLVSIHGFRKSGEPVFKVLEGDECGELVVYEPYSKHFDKLGINVTKLTFSVSPYIETLLLLDHPDLTVYNENQSFKYRDDLFEELNLIPID